MTNVLLNIYEFQAPWAMEYLRNILHGDQQVTILTMSHGDEIPDGKVWKNLYGPGKEIYRVLHGRLWRLWDPRRRNPVCQLVPRYAGYRPAKDRGGGCAVPHWGAAGCVL